ncbi:MAG: OsmC family protein [Bacteroidota bacterium]
MTSIQVKDINGNRTLTNESAVCVNISELDPSDLLAAALAACTGSEVKKLARKKEFDLKDFSIQVDLERNSQTKTAQFHLHLDLDGDLGNTAIRQLHKAAKKSYINRLLSNNIEIKGDVHYQGEVISFDE